MVLKLFIGNVNRVVLKADEQQTALFVFQRLTVQSFYPVVSWDSGRSAKGVFLCFDFVEVLFVLLFLDGVSCTLD